MLLPRIPIAKPLSFSKGIFFQIISFRKIDKRYPTIGPRKGKNGNLTIFGSVKRELWFGPNNNPAY